MIRIANGQGFWGDWAEAPLRLAEGGPLDFLTLDYLAEVTMSVLQKQRKADPALGYARDFPPVMARIGKRVRVVANAGGVNPIACAAEVKRLAPDLKIAVVLGDVILARIDELMGAGEEFRNMDTGAPISTIREHIQSANAYIGAFAIAEALATGADVVITGRCADAALALGPMIHEFGWQETDWDLLAAGVTAGHVIECGTQATGGNCTDDWQSVPDFEDIGYPVVEAHADGSMVITKHENTGGRVDFGTVAEQLVYEIGDPRKYMTPDVVADFTAVQLAQDGRNRVRITQAAGAPRPERLKVSVSYHYGWKATGTLVYPAPDALEKARVADRIVRGRLAAQQLQFEKVYTEFLGAGALSPGDRQRDCPAYLAEVQLRIGIRDSDKKKVERFTRGLIPLVLSGPPGATGYGEGRPAVREIVAFWPALIERTRVQPRVEVLA